MAKHTVNWLLKTKKKDYQKGDEVDLDPADDETAMLVKLGVVTPVKTEDKDDADDSKKGAKK